MTRRCHRGLTFLGQPHLTRVAATRTAVKRAPCGDETRQEHPPTRAERTMDRARSAAHGFVTSRAVRGVALVLVVAVAAFSFEHVPSIDVGPVLYGLVPWTLGTYLLCPLRWHSISGSGRGRRWHLRVYAESELLGLLTPAHSGADLWRVRRLRDTGLVRRAAVAEVGIDRGLAGAGLLAFTALSGGGLPPEVLGPVVGVLAVVAGAFVVRRRRGRTGARPLPAPRTLLAGVALSLGYQVAMFGLVVGCSRAVGLGVGLLTLLGAFGAAQVASLLPGMHGCSAREGAFIAGLVASGTSLSGAVGLVSVITVAAWVPALALGGGSLLLRRLLRPVVTAVPVPPSPTSPLPPPPPAQALACVPSPRPALLDELLPERLAA